MRKKRFFFCISYFTFLFAHGQDAQQNFLDSLSGKLISEIRKQAKPKAWLVTDKSICKPGETIWFRGYLLNSASNKVIHPNTYFFVDLVNDNDSVFASVLLDGASQQLGSKITLPATMPGGYYWLRAYTSQIAKLDINNAFLKPIYVTGRKSRAPSKTSNEKTSLDVSRPVVEFYPEGGNIITGANSTVAVLMKDSEGKPLATDGFVKDTRDSIVARFTSNKLGLAKFELYTSSFRRYKAFINWNGKQVSYPLPSFNLHAGQIAITKQANGNKVLRVLLEDSIYKKNVVTYLVGVSRDSLCYAAIGHDQYELIIPEQKFPEGIATFYLFDKDGRFLSERSIYIKENNIIVKTTTDKNIYSKRDKVILTISVTDANNHPVPALLSVSVADSAFVPAGEETAPANLPDASLVNNPATFGKQFGSDEDVDLLMLLHHKSFPNKNNGIVKQTNDRNDSLLFIKGKALDEKDNPAANKILTLFANNGSASFVMDTTDNRGLFKLPVYSYPDSTEFAIEARNLNNSTANVKIIRDALVFPGFTTPASLKYHFAAEPIFTNKYKTAYFDTVNNNMTIERDNEVTVKGKKKKEAIYNEALRVSPNSTIIAGDQLDERRTTGDIVLTIGGLHMMNGFLVVNGLTAMKAPDRSSEPLLLIDGVPAPEGSGESPVLGTLNSINPKEIDFIEILKGPEGSNYGMRGGNGVILVNMAHQSRQNFKTNAGNLQTFYAKGISRPSVFPLVNYDNKEIRSSLHFDNRSTIYWNGNIVTGAEANSTVTFFTSDVPTTFKVTVTGVTVHGDTIYKTVSITSR